MRKLTALVIGNAAYVHAGVLRNPVNDATDMSDSLRACGFEVVCLPDASHQQMDQALSDFHKALGNQDVGLFFFAGHGVQIQGINYLAASDVNSRPNVTPFSRPIMTPRFGQEWAYPRSA